MTDDDERTDLEAWRDRIAAWDEHFPSRAFPISTEHLSALLDEIDRLRGALIEARDMVASWAAYAPAYFIEKHGLADDLARLDAAIASATGEDQ